MLNLCVRIPAKYQQKRLLNDQRRVHGDTNLSNLSSAYKFMRDMLLFFFNSIQLISFGQKCKYISKQKQSPCVVIQNV